MRRKEGSRGKGVRNQFNKLFPDTLSHLQFYEPFSFVSSLSRARAAGLSRDPVRKWRTLRESS